MCHWQKASYWCSTSSMKQKRLKNRGSSTILPKEIVKYWKISVKKRSELEKCQKLSQRSGCPGKMHDQQC